MVLHPALGRTYAVDMQVAVSTLQNDADVVEH